MFAFLKGKPLVSICVPACRSQAFIGATLGSALGQTVDDIEVIVSNDGGHPTPALDAYRLHPRIRICTPRKRLGWVENSNHVLSRARGEYFMILPHDDRLHAGYLQACLDVLTRDAEVFAAYSDIDNGRIIRRASEVCGPVEVRVAHVMRNLFSGFSYRALMRRRPGDWPRLRMRPNLPTNFCVDTTWILQQACLGELRRVPGPLYRKHLHDGSAQTFWRRLNADQLRTAWRQHCAQMGEIAAAVLTDRQLVDDLVAYRLDANRVPEAPAFLKQVMS